MAKKKEQQVEIIPATSTVAEPPAEITPANMVQEAIAQGAGVEVLERLLALQERWEANKARKAFDAAMAELRKDLPSIVKNQAVDFTTARGRTNYKYEDLSAVVESLAPVLAKNGLSFRWKTVSNTANTVTVTCILSHRDGHCEETSLTSAHDDSGNKNPIQAMGSAVTYLQRYTLKAALGVAAAQDDDGRSVGGGHDDKPQQQQPPRQQQQQQAPKVYPLTEKHNELLGLIDDYWEKHMDATQISKEDARKEILSRLTVWQDHPVGCTAIEQLSEKMAIIAIQKFHEKTSGKKK